MTALVPFYHETSSLIIPNASKSTTIYHDATIQDVHAHLHDACAPFEPRRRSTYINGINADTNTNTNACRQHYCYCRSGGTFGHPPYEPRVTAPPDQDEMLAEQGYYLTTYYACKTFDGGEEHCGWHVPLLRLDSSATETRGFGIGVVLVLGAVLGVLL
ncbi:hypothetical protein B0I35DRAFT_117588 [Stachybotrys elegans]|uniref:Uncharacterized protein n=1 Tax=Stachybotrys elegans TaxID=80388 RepID=A0A8K0T0L6_9HYPO|nr:hypothetical protein B0I35DRAFT_117588 [Stachybotrys elegans]